MTIKDVQKNYPFVDWVDYINTLLPDGLNIDENEVIIISVPTFLSDLGKLLEKTPKR